MARYFIFDGGNLRRLPWESDRTSGLDPTYPARYSAHLTNFHKVLRYHIDMKNEVLRSWLKEDVPNEAIAVGDDVVTHLLGPGSVIEDIVLQVKGICPTEDDAGEPIEPPVIQLRLEQEDGTLLWSENVTVSALGFTRWNMRAVTGSGGTDPSFTGNQNGFLMWRLVSGDASCICFGLSAGIIQYIDPYPCECVAPCGADYPDPDCAPSGLVNPGDIN